MSRKEELALMYAKERRRVQSFYSRYRKKNYAIPENAIPARPKRITEGSIRRLQRMTPAFMKRKMARYEKQLRREKRREQQEINKYLTTPRESYTSKFDSIEPATDYSDYQQTPYDFYSSYDWYNDAKENADATYLLDIKNLEDRTKYAEKYYDKNIIDLSEKELSNIGYTKTSDGFIVDTDTGEIVARDMSAEIQANNDFVDELTQLEEMPQEAIEAFDMFKSEPLTPEEYAAEVNNRRKQEREKNRNIEEQRLKGSSRSSWAQQVINNFIKDIRRFERTAYPLLVELMDSLLAEVDEANIDKAKEALANAIQDTVSEYGRMTKETAYNGEALNQYADSIADKFHDNLGALETLNSVVEESDSSW